MKHQINYLPSGLPVLRIGLPGVKSVTALILANTGSRYENEKEFGIAHFFEHMVFKGTPQYPDPQLLAGVIDGLGADFNAFTSREYTGYYIKSAAEHLFKTLDVLSDMLLQPLLKQEDLERERGVIVEELRMYEDNPMQHIVDQFERMIWEGSGLSHDIIGLEETIRGVNREDFVSFLSKWYGLENMLVVLAGDESVVMLDKTLELVEKNFAKEPEHARAQGKQEANGLKADGFMSGRRLVVVERPTQQAHLIMGWPSLKRGHSRRHALSLLSTIVGGSMSSRLFTEVREKRGLCYYVHSDVEYYRETGFFGASAGVETKRVQEAIQVIKEEFLGVAKQTKKITQEELDRAKEHIAGKTLLSFEDSRSVAQFFGMKQLLLDKIETPEEVIQAIKSVSLAEVHDLAEKLINPDQLRLGVIGPFKESEFAV